MSKRIFCLLIACVMLAFLYACGNEKESTKTAFIKMPDAKIISVEIERYYIGFGSEIEIKACDGTFYVTSVENVVIVEK